MGFSNLIALGSLVISLAALITSYRSRNASLIANMKSELATAAENCNKFILKDTLGHTSTNQELSEIFTTILDSRDELDRFFKKHWTLYVTEEPEDLIRYLYKRLHTSNRELIKNSLSISNYDVHTSPTIEQQHLDCRKFFQSIANG